MAAVLPEMEKSILPPFGRYQGVFNLELHFFSLNWITTPPGKENSVKFHLQTVKWILLLNNQASSNKHTNQQKRQPEFMTSTQAGNAHDIINLFASNGHILKCSLHVNTRNILLGLFQGS